MKKETLYQYCKKHNGADVCNYGYGIMDAIDQQLGFLNRWFPNKHTELKKEFSEMYDQYQIDQIVPDGFHDFANDVENILYSVKIRGYYLVNNDGYLFFVDGKTYRKEFADQ